MSLLQKISTIALPFIAGGATSTILSNSSHPVISPDKAIKCPVTGHGCKDTATIHFKNGQSLSFCCNKCGPEFLKDPSKFVVDLTDQK